MVGRHHRETHFHMQQRRAELLHLESFELSDADLQLLIAGLLDLMAAGQNENSRLIVSTFISRIDIEPGDPVKGTIHYTFPAPERQGFNTERVKQLCVNHFHLQWLLFKGNVAMLPAGTKICSDPGFFGLEFP